MLISHSSLLLFITGAAILLVIPGPAVTYVVSRSVGHGRAAGLVSVLGIVTGTLCHVVAAALGISALLASSAMAFQFVKYLGAAYLVYLGIKTLRRNDEQLVEADTGETKLIRDRKSTRLNSSHEWISYAVFCLKKKKKKKTKKKKQKHTNIV